MAANRIFKFSICHVVAAEKNGGIGYRQKIPWPRIPSDLKRMYNIIDTTFDQNKQNAVIMGRLTWESLPKKKRPIPNSFNVILSSHPSSEFPGADLVCSDFTSAIEQLCSPPLSDKVEKAVVLGGTKVYQEGLLSSLSDTVYYTDVMGEYLCDTFWPGIDETQYQLTETGEEIYEENGVKFRFLVYKRID